MKVYSLFLCVLVYTPEFLFRLRDNTRTEKFELEDISWAFADQPSDSPAVSIDTKEQFIVCLAVVKQLSTRRNELSLLNSGIKKLTRKYCNPFANFCDTKSWNFIYEYMGFEGSKHLIYDYIRHTARAQNYITENTIQAFCKLNNLPMISIDKLLAPLIPKDSMQIDNKTTTVNFLKEFAYHNLSHIYKIEDVSVLISIINKHYSHYKPFVMVLQKVIENKSVITNISKLFDNYQINDKEHKSLASQSTGPGEEKCKLLLNCINITIKQIINRISYMQAHYSKSSASRFIMKRPSYQNINCLMNNIHYYLDSNSHQPIVEIDIRDIILLKIMLEITLYIEYYNPLMFKITTILNSESMLKKLYQECDNWDYSAIGMGFSEILNKVLPPLHDIAMTLSKKLPKPAIKNIIKYLDEPKTCVLQL